MLFAFNVQSSISPIRSKRSSPSSFSSTALATPSSSVFHRLVSSTNIHDNFDSLPRLKLSGEICNVCAGQMDSSGDEIVFCDGCSNNTTHNRDSTKHD